MNLHPAALAALTILGLISTATAQPARSGQPARPWTGIVLWSDNDSRETDAISLEYSYVGYDWIDRGDSQQSDDPSEQSERSDSADPAATGVQYDWSRIEARLDDVASRGHQSILRFYYVYPGKKSTVPAAIKSRSDYHPVTAKSEGEKTEFVDWSNEALKEFTIEFHRRFSRRYDDDPRLAYVQVGFGLWGEYHIYDGPRKLGQQFPDKQFQKMFLTQLDQFYVNTPWMISVDAADDQYTPIVDDAELLELGFGVFDDSFLSKQHAKQNEPNWNDLRRDRYLIAPAGGEFSYYNRRDQKLALSPDGPNGESFAVAASRFHISFMIGADQPRYQSIDTVRSASLGLGYRFELAEKTIEGRSTMVVIKNSGIAPAYHDCYVALGSVRSDVSLKGLPPGESRLVRINAAEGELSIESNRLVPGQRIPLDRNL